MGRLFFLLSIFFICAIFFSACRTPSAVNNSSNVNTAVNNLTSNNSTAASADSNIASVDDRDQTEFEGTTATTEKSNMINPPATLKDVRTGDHKGFDRVVFEFEGEQLPGYAIEYLNHPVSFCGSGDTVELLGNARLEIRFIPANAHTEQGESTIQNLEQTPNLTSIKQVKSTCDFEAHVTWAAGISVQKPYRILELTAPTRLVVDVSH